MKVDKSKWGKKKLSACLQKFKTSEELQKREYLESGLFPVISQEKEFISGYSNRQELVNHIEKPIVIFGDHTRICKYIDFNFIIGADGVKVINPIDEIKSNYLFYYIKWSNIPSNGYSRHYKFLKAITIKIPPLPEQQSIASELDSIQSLITKYREQLNDYDNLAKSIFNEMFGDVVSNDKGWERKKLGDVCRIFGRIGFRGYTKNDFVYSALEGCITLSPSNIDGFGMNYKKCSYISWFKYEQSPEIKIYDGDILIVKTGSSYGKCAIVSNLPHKATINPQFVVLKQITCDNIYLYRYLTTDFVQTQYDNFVGGAAIPTFSQAKLSKLLVSLPPLPLQQKFAARITAIEAQKDNVKQQIADLQTLFDSRMQYYFD